MENLNLVELLRDCPTGMELDSTVFDNVTFDYVNTEQNRIYCKIDNRDTVWFTAKGCINLAPSAKCVIFPKGKTTWKGFQRPFNDGDILAYTSSHTTVFIYRNRDNEPKYTTSFYVGYTIGECYRNFNIYDKNLLIALNGDCDTRLATEEEKQKLFQAIKDNGYHWNAETKTLEKLPKFKVGDRVKHISAYASGIVVKVNDKGYHIDYPKGEGVCFISFELEKDYELAPNKFDITTLKPFDKVLVRNTNTEYWRISLFGAIVHDDRRYFMCLANSGFYQCIPYEHNEHLLGTNNNCDDFYKTWENNN